MNLAAIPHPPPPMLAAFVLLALAMLAQCLRLERVGWFGGVLAIGVAALSGLLQPLGLLSVAAALILTGLVRFAPRLEWRLIWLALLLTIALHALPGYANPLLWQGRATPDSEVFRLYWSFDKGLAGWLLLCGAGQAGLAGKPWGSTVAWVGCLLLALTLALAQVMSMVSFAPKWPVWLAPWLFANVFLVALPEEALFRHGAQRWLQNRVEPFPALIAASLLFGAAHLAGGWSWMMLASLAGLGYGLVYAATGQVLLAALAHAGFNLAHLLLFTYPRLAAY